MKNFMLSEMLIVSERERAARRIRFSEDLTVLEGPNDTGKSAIIKSIYWALGAEPGSMPQRWLGADPTVVLEASIDDTPITFLRKGRLVAVFGDDRKRLGAFVSITNELAPFLAAQLDFALLLTDRQFQLAVPPPAYMFLPFYIDQDISWNRPWSSFSRLQQFTNWKQQLVEYHVGIRDRRWYDLEHRIITAKRSVAEASSELDVLRRMRSRATEAQAAVEFNLDLALFKEEVDELVSAANDLHQREVALQQRYAEMHVTRRHIAEQIRTVELAIGELAADRQYLSHHVLRDSVECPTCGAEYSNSFGERFAIAQDEARLVDFLAELKQDLASADDGIDSINQEFKSTKAESSRIDAVLAASKDGVTFETIVRDQGHYEFRSQLRTEADAAMRAVRDAEVATISLQKQKRALNKENADQREIVQREHAALMRRYLARLDVRTLGDDDIKILATISESGSSQPRALLAYFFSILNLIAQHGTGFFAPIVIDEPNQQGQDGVNMPAILEFIAEERPKGRQLILGIESDHGVALPGRKVILNEKLAALSKSEFVEVRERVAPLLEAALALH